MSARIAAFLVWALVALGATYWALRIGATPRPLPDSVQTVATAGLLRGDIARLFASPAAPAQADALPSEPALASRFKLVGVMAPRNGAPVGRQGVALIAVDGKPARAYRVGARLDGALVLQTVALRSATLGPVDGAPAVRLDLAPLPPPATGSLQSAAAGLGAAAALGARSFSLPPPAATPPIGNVQLPNAGPPPQDPPDDGSDDRAVGAEPGGAPNPADNRR